MNKYLILAALVATISGPANAGFETKSDSLQDKREKRAAELQREVDKVEYSRRSAEELAKTNALILEQNKKMDELIEQTKINNQLMQELLDGLE